MDRYTTPERKPAPTKPSLRTGLSDSESLVGTRWQDEYGRHEVKDTRVGDMTVRVPAIRR